MPEPGIEPIAIKMPTMTVRVAQEVRFGLRTATPHRAISVAWQMILRLELLEQAHIGK
jgi:hypothetical protein